MGGLVTDDHRESQLLTGNSGLFPLQLFSLIKYLLLLFAGTSTHCTHVKARGQLAGVDSVLLPFAILRVWGQAPCLAEPSCWS